MNGIEPATKKPVLLIFLACFGWGAFVATLIYGVTVYGPAKYIAGVNSEIIPPPLTPAIGGQPEGDTPDGDRPSDMLVIATVKSVQENSLTVSFLSADTGQPVEKTYLYADDAVFMKRTVTSTERVEGDNVIEQGGQVTEQVIQRSSLSPGMQVELGLITQDGEQLIHEVIAH